MNRTIVKWLAKVLCQEIPIECQSVIPNLKKVFIIKLWTIMQSHSI